MSTVPPAATAWESIRDHVGPWNEKDFLALPEGFRAELFNGRLIVTPSPTPAHQNASSVLWMIFSTMLGRSMRAIQATDMRLADGAKYRNPDVMVLRHATREHPIKPDNVVLVVEIISPGGGDERTQKMTDYAEAGIPGYLIVQESTDGFAAWHHVLRGDHYELVSEAEPGGELVMTEPIACTIDLTSLEW